MVTQIQRGPLKLVHNVPFIRWVSNVIHHKLIPGVRWLNHECTKFSIPWVKCNILPGVFTIFQLWALNKGIENSHQRYWKMSFKRALYLSPINEISRETHSWGEKRVFQFFQTIPVAPEGDMSKIEPIVIGSRVEVEVSSCPVNEVYFGPYEPIDPSRYEGTFVQECTIIDIKPILRETWDSWETSAQSSLPNPEVFWPSS